MLTEIDTAIVIEPLETRLRERLEFLKKSRDEYIATAQRQISALDGAIGEISALLNPPPADASQNGTSDEVPPA